ncbi:protein starmaker-like [Chenopodium quinoa]|uniref:protein starmaker-like n=1 Tax=Chenopodium quinoa TaxID=63459 RepID=UPI000B77B529|nr:protein starmaker-like [Chenopodium quinoa]
MNHYKCNIQNKTSKRELSILKQKENEGFTAYLCRLRETVAQMVDPPKEKEMVRLFIQNLTHKTEKDVSEKRTTEKDSLEKNHVEQKKLNSDETDVPSEVKHLLQFRDGKSETLTLKKVIGTNELGCSYQRYTLNNNEQSENVSATHTTTKIGNQSESKDGKQDRDQSEKDVEQKQDAITSEKDKQDVDQRKYKESTIRIMQNLKRMEKASKIKKKVGKASKKLKEGGEKPKEKVSVKEKSPKKEKSPEKKNVEDDFPKTTELKEGEKENVQEDMPKTTEMKDTIENEKNGKRDATEILPEFVQIEDETHLIDPEKETADLLTKMSKEPTASSQKNVVLDESAERGQKEATAQLAEASQTTPAIKDQKKRISQRTSPIQKRAGAPAEKIATPAPIRRMAGGKKSLAPTTAEGLKKNAKKAKIVVGPPKKNVGKRIKNTRSTIDEPSQEPSSTDNGDDSEDSIYKAEKEFVSEEIEADLLCSST